MFLGEYLQKLTGKGRILLPQKMRQQVKGETIVLSKGFEKCLFGYDQERWERTSTRQLESSVTQISARDLRRYLFSAASTISLDSQGRFVIPPRLTEYANIKENAVIIGAGDHFEIWNPESWGKKVSEIEKQGPFDIE